MGGFNTSAQIESMLKDLDKGRDYVPEYIYEVIEQAIVMTKCFERGDTEVFKEWSRLFKGITK